MAWGRERARANQRERVGLGASGTGLAGDTSRVDGSTVSQMWSRIRGTRRSQEDTTGHDDARNQVQEDTGGHGGIREDTRYAGFGTVRPRVQIPGPRPNPLRARRAKRLDFGRVRIVQ